MCHFNILHEKDQWTDSAKKYGVIGKSWFAHNHFLHPPVWVAWDHSAVIFYSLIVLLITSLRVTTGHNQRKKGGKGEPWSQ